MNKIIFLNHDRPQRIGYRNDVLFGATVFKGSKKRSRKKVNAGELNKVVYDALYQDNQLANIFPI